MKIRVRVTQSHINNGIQFRSKACPIYLSLANRKKVVYIQYVTPSKIIIGGRSIRTPASARSFIRSFDNYGPDAVKPFSFVLEIP